MAKITYVDYEAMPSHASTMRTLGGEMNNIFTEIYQSIQNLHENWFGKRYDELVRQFNNLIPQLNSLLDLVVGDFPFTLETVANNYAQADTGSKVVSAQKTAPTKISELPVLNDTGMKFITTEVQSVQTSVSSNFDAAEGKMNSIEEAYKRIEWESEASQAFATKFANLKSQILESFENLNTQFTNLMNQTLEDLQTTENSNTVQ